MKKLLATLSLTAATIIAPAVSSNEKVLLWGDTHLHTNNSFDAFLNNNLSADPDTAFRWAKGEPVIHPYHRARVQIGQPLDFLVVSDHSEYLGGLKGIYFDGIKAEDPGLLDSLIHWYTERALRDAMDSREGAELFNNSLPTAQSPQEAAKNWGAVVAGTLPAQPSVVLDTWTKFAETADHHNQPGKFTALIGWEWSSTPGGANLHRIIVTSANAESAKKIQPFSSGASPYPEDLFTWLQKTQDETGIQFLSIPHNSNLSKGIMFSEETLAGEPMTADQARVRMQWEPVVEVTQIKGDSETHPDLSPDDPFANFEKYNFYLEQQPAPYVAGTGDFIRSGLKTGLSLGKKLGVNPFEFGMIGSTDSHTGWSSAEEPNFWGKMATDSTPETKTKSVIAVGPTGWTMSASGMAAVWADANTRDDIIAAMKRREVYATTGPRIRVQFFVTDTAALAATPPGGGALPDDWKALAGAITPMGGETSHVDGQSFVVTAQQDPNDAPLDRIQIIKGWIDAAGETQEKIFDVAWSTQRDMLGTAPAPIADEVDRRTGRYTGSSGAADLSAIWVDAEASAHEKAFDYARVLQVPTARHSLLDALALGKDASQEGPDVIQERAYTSPIWINP